jgi:hypothetical protein
MAYRYGRHPGGEMFYSGQGPILDAEALLVLGIRITRE